ATMHREHDRLTSRTLGLGSAELLFGRAELIYELPERIAAVTTDEVAAAAKALRPESRAVLIVNPASNGGTE
ncbi:MAG TPA: insulinase family protein, partial [Pseudonocardiaceae bacterium]|nr:insulinase family protein [Pseudonocardiaceae bacterium]